jgi:hypothetical protein
MQILETIIYIGWNRRSDRCVIEQLFELESAELEALSSHAGTYRELLCSTLQEMYLSSESVIPIYDDTAVDPLRIFADLYSNTAITLQRASGHDVSYVAIMDSPHPRHVRAVFEYEHSEVGERAGTLALSCLASVIPEFDCIDLQAEVNTGFADQFTAFQEFARPRILPVDTQAIINAATHLDIPWVKLDRDPYQGLEGEFRIRKNGLLKLGHSIHHRIVDGTLCLDGGDHLANLARDREQLFQYLSGLNAPTAQQDPEFRNCVNFRRAERSAKSIGYPVVVKPWQRRRGEGVSLNITDSSSLRNAVASAQKNDRKVMVEKYVYGDTYKVIVANGEVTGVVANGEEKNLLPDTHNSTLELIQNLAEKLQTGILVVDVVTPDISTPLEEQGGAIVDVDIAPELDGFLSKGSAVLERSMAGFVRWLFPEGKKSRVPIVAITGTNGKTTTSRMITGIAQSALFNPGLACSDGVYINGQLMEAGDLAGAGGHHKLLESREVNLCIFETARGGLAHSGLMFDWCDVAVCLNVTEDHLGEFGIETVEEMAVLHALPGDDPIPCSSQDVPGFHAVRDRKAPYDKYGYCLLLCIRGH